MMEKISILGVGITSAKTEEILEYIWSKRVIQGKKCFISTPNPEIVVYAAKHPGFKEIVNSADISLADGVGLLWASRFLGKSLKNRVTGIDLTRKLCGKAANRPITVGFLGAGPRIAEKAAECLKKQYPGLRVGLAKGWDPSKKTADMIKERFAPKKDGSSTLSHLDILFVAYGFPKQEEWIAKYLPELPVTVAMGVGGALDYISGNVSRSPHWVSSLGFEWLYRLAREPWRLRRQLALLVFVKLVLFEKLGRK